MDLEDLAKLKDRASRLQTKIDKAQGALDHLYSRLSDEFGCSTLEEAKDKLAKLGRQEKKAERKFNNAAKQFEKEWGDVLDDESEEED